MRSLPKFATLALLASLAVLPANATVVATGKPSKGYFWQKVGKANGQTQMLCRSTSSATIQKSSACTKAGAKQP